METGECGYGGQDCGGNMGVTIFEKPDETEVPHNSGGRKREKSDNSSGIEDTKSTSSPTLKDVLSIFNWAQAISPFWIIKDPNYYINPIGFRMSNTLSATWNNGSPVTVSNTGFTAIGGDGPISVRFTLNSDSSSNYGIFTSRQMNSVLKQSLGFSLLTILDPQERTIRSSVRATVALPSGDRLTVASTTSTQIRYNPHGAIGALVVGVILAPKIAIGGYIGCRQLGL